MRKAFRFSCLVCVIILLAGCPKKPEVETGGPAAGPHKNGPPPAPNGPPPVAGNGDPVRLTGRSFLVRGQTEGQGYGLYSYILFGSPPSNATRARYLRAIEAFLQLIPEVSEFEKLKISREELNITYIPLVHASEFSAVIPADWVLENYDHARAQVLLRTLPGTHRDGPYIVSVLTPLSQINNLTEKYLFQDMSHVPPHLISLWVKDFINQAAQERFWEENTANRLARNLRTKIAIVATGLPDVQAALGAWIFWRP